MTARTADVPVRTADPYRDIEVIDSRAPRFNQAVIGSLALIAFLVDWWPLLAVLAAQLVVGLLFGRRYCLPCVAYFEWVQPRVGEGAIEDSRPPRFANTVGVVVLTAASILHLVGLTVAGWALGLLVAGLALLAAITGLCVGCELYKWGARSAPGADRSVATSGPGRPGRTDSPMRSIVVQFTHPWCTDCQNAGRAAS